MAIALLDLVQYNLNELRKRDFVIDLPLADTLLANEIDGVNTHLALLKM